MKCLYDAMLDICPICKDSWYEEEKRIKGEAEEWENFDFSHVEPAFYNNDQSIWDDDDTPMNANLDAVNTYEAFHVTHWMELPEPPKEE